ncbi:phage late control D family protein [Gibbsiella dentisursi]|uniref:Phage late control D family protein n=1 Tax=Gibbsiella dentisursi TaxID=796890 RepID=A0ABP7M3S6_9GAMM
MTLSDSISQLESDIEDYSPRPDFNVTVGDKTITLLNDRMMSLTLTDNRGLTADTVEMTLDDSDGKLVLPTRGTQISVAMGWKGQPLVFKGCFIVDEITYEGPPDTLTISARSADFRDTFNVKRERSWHNCTVGYVVSAIASQYGLKAGLNEALGNIDIDHADQTNESDLSFLTRMGEMLNAVPMIKNGMLLFIIPGMAQTQSGKVLPVTTLTRKSGDRFSFSIADRDAYTGVEAYWLDENYGKKKKVSLRGHRKSTKTTTPASSSKTGHYLDGAEGNVYVMRQTFKTEQAARRAADAKWRQLKRGAAQFRLTLARGQAELYPELHVQSQGFKAVIDEADWIITRATHTIGESGFTTALELEVKITDWVTTATDK